MVTCVTSRPFSNLDAQGLSFAGTIELKSDSTLLVDTGYKVFGSTGSLQGSGHAQERILFEFVESSALAGVLSSTITALYLAFSLF